MEQHLRFQFKNWLSETWFNSHKVIEYLLIASCLMKSISLSISIPMERVKIISLLRRASHR